MAELAPTILVVEDDPAVAESLVEGIAREGYGVHGYRPAVAVSPTPATPRRT